MARAVFLNTPAYGHVNPTLPVVKELVARGETVVYFATGEFRQKVEGTGAILRCYADFPPVDPAVIRGHPFGLATQMVEDTQVILPGVLRALREEAPDYLIHDVLSLAGRVAAQVLGIPAVASIPTLVFSGSRPPLSALPRILWMTVTGRPYLRRFRQASRAIASVYGVAPVGLGEAFGYGEALNIVYTSRAFQPGGEALDESYRFVGPCIAPRDDVGDFPLGRLEGGPVIYISLGTVVNLRPDFYRLCFEAFGDCAGPVVLSTGRQVEPASLGGPPGHFMVRQHVPQLDVLERADLFITHGGMNSVQEGLYYDVPLLVLPQTAEQATVADRVVALGAGLRLQETGLTPGTLREAADRLLSEPAFRANSRRIGETLRAAGGYRRAVDEIFAFKAAHGL